MIENHGAMGQAAPHLSPRRGDQSVLILPKPGLGVQERRDGLDERSAERLDLRVMEGQVDGTEIRTETLAGRRRGPTEARRDLTGFHQDELQDT
jgi:hypothetical protein